jgi:hypothetical protein
MISVESMLSSSFENLSISHEEINKEYELLLKNIELLKNNKNYTKAMASKLHNKNLDYKAAIIFKAFNKEQMEIRNHLANCLKFDPKTEHILYCLKTKKLLNAILTYIDS